MVEFKYLKLANVDGMIISCHSIKQHMATTVLKIYHLLMMDIIKWYQTDKYNGKQIQKQI